MIFKRKGNVGLYIVISVFVLTITTLNVLSYISTGLKLSDNYFKIVKTNNNFQTVKANVIQDLETTTLYGSKTYQYNNFDIKILPIKIEDASPPDYNDTTVEPVLDSLVLDRVNTKESSSIRIDKIRQYLIYCLEDEFKLYSPRNIYLGTSSNHGYVLKRNLIGFYGFGNYLFETANGKYVYLIGLQQWDKYKFNAIYEITIIDTNSNNKMKVVVHKIENKIDELISILYY